MAGPPWRPGGRRPAAAPARSTAGTGATSSPPAECVDEVQRVPAACPGGRDGGLDVQRQPGPGRLDLGLRVVGAYGDRGRTSSRSSRCRVAAASACDCPPIGTPSTVVPFAMPEPAATYSPTQATAAAPTTAPASSSRRRVRERPANPPVSRAVIDVRWSGRSGRGGRPARRRPGRPRHGDDRTRATMSWSPPS